MPMRGPLLAVVLTACASPTPATPAAIAKVDGLDAWVMDADGPVADVEVRVVPLARPDAQAGWRQRLAACTWPVEPRQILRSDAHGHVRVVADAGSYGLEAITPSGLGWVVPPAGAERVAIELAEPITPRLVVDDSAELRATLLFEDGRCVPFRRAGTNAWVAAAPVPRAEAWPTLVVEAAGVEPIVQEWYQAEEELELELLDPDPTDSVVSYRTWRHGCREVEVVDLEGRPIAGASVVFDPRPNVNGLVHGGGDTDEHGRTCVEAVGAGGELIAHPPGDRGGWCAGEARLLVTAAHRTGPIRIVLPMRALERATGRGRLVSPEGIPIAGAQITAGSQPSETPGCSTGAGASTTTRVDGSFELPPLPRGAVTLLIQHDWYTEREVTIAVPGPERPIVLDRGFTWTGRVLDPDGTNIERCELFLHQPGDRHRTATCSPTGFTFTRLVPGEAKVQVRIDQHALGQHRTLERTLRLTGPRRRDDLRWSAGETIAGRVVDAGGAPIAGARLTALPKGTEPLSNRFHPDEVMVEADGDGRFVFRHLRPGVWTIRGDLRAPTQATMDLPTSATAPEIVFVTSPGR